MKERIYKGCERKLEAKKFNNIKEIINNCKETNGRRTRARRGGSVR